MLAKLAKAPSLTKMAILAKFHPGCDKMIRVNKLTQLQRPQNVGEFGNFGKILPRLLTKKCWRKQRIWRNFAKVAMPTEFCQGCGQNYE